MLTISQLTSTAHLFWAARKARRGKSRRADVEAWGLRRESDVLRMQRELRTGCWWPLGYREFWIREPKRRRIAAAPFADRVVHHAVCAQLNPWLEEDFHTHSYSCRVGYGTVAAREHVRTLVNRHPYVLKCDVRKFFESIPHVPLLERLKLAVPMEDLVFLVVQRILDSHRNPANLEATGLPIGNFTSQWWGNFYLTPLDSICSGLPGIRGYVRYTDDFLLFSDSKADLWAAHERILVELAAIGLALAVPKSRLLACREGVPFCGFRFFPNLRPRVLGATVRRFKKRQSRLLKAGEMGKALESTFAWYQFAKEGNTKGLKQAWARRQRKC